MCRKNHRSKDCNNSLILFGWKSLPHVPKLVNWLHELNIHGGVVEVEEGAEKVLRKDGGEHADGPVLNQRVLPLQYVKEDRIKIGHHHKSIHDEESKD